MRSENVQVYDQDQSGQDYTLLFHLSGSPCRWALLISGKREKNIAPPACYCLPSWQNIPQGRSRSISSSSWGDFNPYFTPPWRVPNCYAAGYYATPSVSAITFYTDYVRSHWAKKREKANLTLQCGWREELDPGPCFYHHSVFWWCALASELVVKRRLLKSNVANWLQNSVGYCQKLSKSR